jgi:hypothetical protein
MILSLILCAFAGAVARRVAGGVLPIPGGTLVAREPIMPTTGAKAQADTSSAARVRLGLALEAGVTGDLVEAFINPQYLAQSAL